MSFDISLGSIAEGTAQRQQYDRGPRGSGIILHRAPSHTLPSSIDHHANVHSPFDQRSLPACEFSGSNSLVVEGGCGVSLGNVLRGFPSTRRS